MSALAFCQRALLEPQRGPRLRPSFAWDFRRKALHPAMSFSRGSAGWTWENGLLVQKAADVPRFWTDPATGVPWGLLVEPQSTNQIAYSTPDTTHWTGVNGGTGSLPVLTLNDSGTPAPDGTQTATKVVFNTGAGTSSADQSRLAFGLSGLTAGASYGSSLFVKGPAGTKLLFDGVSGGGDLLVITCTGGWDRVSTIQTAIGTTTNYLVGIRQGTPAGTINGSATVWLWGAQMDSAGVGVTSYIPTSGNTVTRSKDIPVMPMAAVPGWDATSGGVLLATFRMHTPAVSYSPVAAAIADPSFNNAVALYGDYGTATSADVYSGGARQARPTGSASSTWTRRKVSAGWSTSRIVVATDGTTGGIASGSYALPIAPTNLYPGSWSAVSQINGTLESVAYFRGTRPDAFVQAVSR